MDITFSYLTRQIIIVRILKVINQLPEDRAEKISTYADCVFKRYEEHEFTKKIQKLASESQAFDFLKFEDDIYTIANRKEVYNG